MSDLDTTPITGEQLTLPAPAASYDSVANHIMDYATALIEVSKDCYEQMSFTGYSRRTIVIRTRITRVNHTSGPFWSVQTHLTKYLGGGEVRTRTWESPGMINDLCTAKGVATRKQAHFINDGE